MSGEQRLRRLRHLLDQLERLPASPERERMLREVRGRFVDVDTGVPPQAMMPVGPEPEPEPASRPAPRTERERGPAVRKPAHEVRRPRAVPAPEPARAVLPPRLGAAELLSLDDSAPSPPAGPWTRGLRG